MQVAAYARVVHQLSGQPARRNDTPLGNGDIMRPRGVMQGKMGGQEGKVAVHASTQRVHHLCRPSMLSSATCASPAYLCCWFLGRLQRTLMLLPASHICFTRSMSGNSAPDTIMNSISPTALGSGPVAWTGTSCTCVWLVLGASTLAKQLNLA